MDIYIPEKYDDRTEYQMLKNWHTLLPISLKNISQASQANKLVIIGRLLNNLDGDTVTKLKEWTFQEGNQLLCLPSWKEIDISDCFNLKINLKVKKGHASYDKWGISELKYYIKCNLQEGIITKGDQGHIFNINYREHQYSGVLTLTTLPLLDYTLMMEEELLQKEFNNLLINNEKNIIKKNNKSKDKITDEAIYILILAGAGINIKNDLTEKIKLYFHYQPDIQKLKAGKEILIEKGLLGEEESITDNGMKFIKSKGYLAYLREIKRKMRDADARF